jgi:hypothetical protein
MDLIRERLAFGEKKYGHGVRVRDDTTTWGTPVNSWLHMALEEYLDGIIYVVADYIRTQEIVFSEPDDNKRIIFLLKHPELINSEKHQEMVHALFKLIKMCL